MHVELYRELQRNGPAKCLQAALRRFGELAHLIRPVKSRFVIVVYCQMLFDKIQIVCTTYSNLCTDYLYSTRRSRSRSIGTVGWQILADIRRIFQRTRMQSNTDIDYQSMFYSRKLSNLYGQIFNYNRQSVAVQHQQFLSMFANIVEKVECLPIVLQLYYSVYC